MKEKNIYEKFSEEGDPIKDMGIGMREYLRKEYNKIPLNRNSWTMYDQYFKPIYGDAYNTYAVYLVRIFIQTLRAIIASPISPQQAFEEACEEEYGSDSLNDNTINNIRRITAEFLNKKYDLGIDVKWKRRRKKVNEEFSEKGDPIKDMGIGSSAYYKEIYDKLPDGSIWTYFDLFFAKICPRKDRDPLAMLLSRILVQTIRRLSEKTDWSAQKAFEETCIHEFPRNTAQSTKDYVREKVAQVLQSEFDIIVDPLNESLNEKFTEKGDPIHDMGIGISPELLEEIHDYYVHRKPDEKDKELGIDDYLWLCSATGKTEYVKALLRAGADVHTQNDWSLRRAVVYNHPDVVDELLKYGADPHANNDEALKHAKFNGLGYLYDILKKYADKKVNEKFSEKGDPITDMGIGYKYESIRLKHIKAAKKEIKEIVPDGYGWHPDHMITLESSKDEIKNFKELAIKDGFADEDIIDILIRGVQIGYVSVITYRQNNFYFYFNTITGGIYDAGDVFIISRDILHFEETGKIHESLNEKFTEDGDPIKDLGIGAKFVYYRLSKFDMNSYVMYIYGDSYNIRDILKKYGFKWDKNNYAWKSNFSMSKESWKINAPAIFQKIQSVGSYIIQPKGKITKFDIDLDRSFYIPGYEHAEYPWIPDGKGLKVYFKQWHHSAPMIGVAGKGSYIGKDVLRYDGYVFNKSKHMWERMYDKEDVDELIKYFESKGYTVIDGRRKEVTGFVSEKFSEEGDPIKDLGIGEVPAEYIMKQILKEDLKKDKKIIWIGAQYGIRLEISFHHIASKEDTLYAKQLLKDAGVYHFYKPTLRRVGYSVYAYTKSEYRNIIKNRYGLFPVMSSDIILEKFEEHSDPIKDMIAGIRDFWIKMRAIEGKSTSTESSIDYFGSPNFPEEAYVVFLVLGEVIKQNVHSQEDIQRIAETIIRDWYNSTKENRGRKLNVKKIIQALSDKFLIEVDEFDITPKKIDEKFYETGDPIHDMGIGSKEYYKKIYDDLPNVTVWSYFDLYFKDVCKEKDEIFASELATMLISTIRILSKRTITPEKAFSIAQGKQTYHMDEEKDKKYVSEKVIEVLKKRFNIDINVANESVNEKFCETGDPIHDMGIGNEVNWENIGKGNLIYNNDSIYVISNVERLKNGKLKITFFPFSSYHKTIYKELKRHYKNRNDIIKDDTIYNSSTHVRDLEYWVDNFEIAQPRKLEDSVMEKFSETGDPIKDMGLGLAALKNKLWNTKFGIIEEEYFSKYKDTYLPYWHQLNYSQILVEMLCDIIALMADDLVDRSPQEAFEEACDKYVSDLAYFISDDYDQMKDIYKRRTEILAKVLYENWKIKVDTSFSTPVYEKFTENTDPIEDMGISDKAKFEKALFEFIRISSQGFWSTIDKIETKNSDIIIDVSHDPFEDNFSQSYHSAFNKSGIDKFAKFVHRYAKSTFSDYYILAIKEEFKYIIDNIESIQFKRIYLNGRFVKNRQMYNYEIKINWKNVSEAFSETGDPIKDMGIGIYTHRNFANKTEFLNFLLKAIPVILDTDEIPKNILHTSSGIMNTKIFKKLNKYLCTYCSVKGINVGDSRCVCYLWPRMVFDALYNKGYESKYVANEGFVEAEDIRNSLNEKFKEESDPIKDMGIGGHLIYDVIFYEDDEEFEYETDNDAIIDLIKKYIPEISDNEIRRFIEFTLHDRIINEIPPKLLMNKDYKTIDKYIKNRIQSEAGTWMWLHSDKTINTMYNRMKR